MADPDLSDMEVQVLQTVRDQEGTDLYELSRAVGVGPRAVQETVRRLVHHDFVHVSGRRVRCTRSGDQWIRRHQ